MNHSLRLLFSTLLPAVLCGPAVAQQSQIEQARQFEVQAGTARPRIEASGPSAIPGGSFSANDDGSFGVQQILKRQERVRPFRVFADVSAFYSNNVALTREDEQSDSFLVASFGMEYRRPLATGLQLEATVKGAMFRYGKLDGFDFQSLDVGAGLTYHATKLWDVDFFARYNFTDLWSADSGDEFFKNHTVTLGAQKAFVFSRAHYAYLGTSAQFGFADPRSSERDEYSAFAGYHLQATRKIEADLLYRYGYFVYSENERRDHNNTVSLSFRYQPVEWVSVFTSTYVGINRSDEEVFDYEAANVGGGLGLSVQF